MGDIYQLVVERGKMVPPKVWEALETGRRHSHHWSTNRHFHHRRFGKQFWKRNKRQAALFVGGLALAGASGGGVALLVGVPIAAAGYGIKRAIIATVRRPKYKFVKRAMAGLDNQSQEAYRGLILDEEKPGDALKNLMHWFRHRHGSNISAVVDRVLDVRQAYEVFKAQFNRRTSLEYCDDAVKAAEKMMLYLAVLNSVESDMNLFGGCFHYVKDAIDGLNQEFDEKRPQFLEKVWNHTQQRGIGFHKTRCSSKCCYRAHGRKGQGNYRGPQKNISPFFHLLQDAAHSNLAFGHGGKDRGPWIVEAIGLPETESFFRKAESGGLESGPGGYTREFVENIAETTLGLPVDTYSGNIPGNVAGQQVSEWTENTVRVSDWMKTDLGIFQTTPGSGPAQNLFNGLAGGWHGVGQTIGAAVVEMANSFWNKHRLTHYSALTPHELSIKHSTGRNRLDILRANLKGGGILEDWVSEFLAVQKHHEEFKRLLQQSPHNCMETYLLARAALARQYHLVQFASAHRYVQEFYDGVVGKVARMTVRWAIMSDRITTEIDQFMSAAHSRGECDPEHCLFCYCHDTEPPGRTMGTLFQDVSGNGSGFETMWPNLNVELNTAGFKKGDIWRRLMEED
jgi:hypothetical protein